MIGENVLNSLKNEISTKEYERYIKQLFYVEKESKSNLRVFYVPNTLIGNWIKTKYSEKIIHLFEVQTGIKPELKIILKTNKSATRKKQYTFQDEAKNEKNTILMPSFNFDSFVAGPSNQLAYSAALTVAKKSGIVYNPVFFYGPTGLGKTHLIQAVGNYAQSKNKIVIYVTSEQFMNDFTYNVQNHTMDRFRDKYRKCDVLLIDDVQFLSNKVQTQEEFFNTFNELHINKRQIIMTSDKPPKMINGLDERLQSRFEWGLIADITMPELETKIAIIKKKCEFNKINLTSDIINYIAANMGENIREIEGAIININAHASFMRQDITLEFAKNVVKEQIKQEKENITLEKIINIIAKTLNVKLNDIKSKNRTKNIVEARRICIYLARDLTPNSTPELAKFFGMKDHTAISHNIKKINQLIQDNEHFKLRVDELKNKILTKDDK